MADVIQIDSKTVRILLGDLEGLPDDLNTRRMVTSLSMFLSARMKSRTLQGLDVEMNQFAPYSPSYEAFRAKKGRGTNVDLTFSGQMLAGIIPTTISDTEAKVSMADAVQGRKGIIHQMGLGPVPERRFFGISDGDHTAKAGIDRIFNDSIDLAVKKFLNRGQ